METNYIKKTLNKYLIKSIIVIYLFFFLSNNLVYANTFAENNYSRAVLDEDGYIYLDDNLNKRIYPASLTKIAIAIIAIEKFNLNKKVKIVEMEDIPYDYVLTPLYVGETLTIEDLLYANLLKSGNDASIQLAYKAYGSHDKFIKKASNYFKKLGMKDTNFTNAFGLEDPNHYTTPYDLLVLTKHAMKNEIFRKIVSTEKYTIPENEYSGPRVLKSTSLFVTKGSSFYDERFKGVKTGYTEDAGECLISSATISDKEFYFIYTGGSTRESKFIEIKNTYLNTKDFIDKKEFLDEYAKAINKENKANYITNSYFYSNLMFQTYNKIVLILFLSLLIQFFIKINYMKKSKRRKKRKK